MTDPILDRLEIIESKLDQLLTNLNISIPPRKPSGDKSPMPIRLPSVRVESSDDNLIEAKIYENPLRVVIKNLGQAGFKDQSKAQNVFIKKIEISGARFKATEREPFPKGGGWLPGNRAIAWELEIL